MRYWTKDELAVAFGHGWFDHQHEVLDGEAGTDYASLRVCLYYATGKGKTKTALAVLAQAGVDEALVLAPPKTHGQWQLDAAKVGIKLRLISHAKYRQPGVKFSRTLPLVVDEFHLLGGHTGQGWKKLRVHARYIQAPLLIMSATPNYNDAERVYCVSNVLDPIGSVGGYETWIYEHCRTRMNPHGKLPLVEGFKDGRPAKEHLAELPHVYYVPDPYEDFPIEEVILSTSVPPELEEYGLDTRRRRIVASRMEYESASRKHQLLDDDGILRTSVTQTLWQYMHQTRKPVMVFCARSTIAAAADAAMVTEGARSGLVIGTTSPRQAEHTLHQFKDRRLDVLFGTATMSTGVDGLDKVSDMLILLDDTDDTSLRRQVIGRILPRGDSTDVSKKRVIRFNLGS